MSDSKRRRVTAARPIRRAGGRSRGGRSHSPEYASWYSANRRCSRPSDPGYPAYGARGIRVCDRWAWPGGFERFLVDMGPRPKGTSLDRIDVNGNYEPGNCRWADDETQRTNRRPVSRDALRARHDAMRALTVPRRIERLEERLLRGVADALIAEFGPIRNPDAIDPADFQVSESVVSSYEFRGVNVRAA